MKRFKLRTMQSKTPTVYTKSLDCGYGIDLSTANSLYKLGIHGVGEDSALTEGPNKILPLGDLKNDGSYEFALHCHGENIVGGEELADAILALSETSDYITASVENNLLTFASRNNKPMFSTGRLRGANNEVFTALIKFSAPENTGTIISSGIAFTFATGVQNISYTQAYNGETVQVAISSNATRQLINLSLVNTQGKTRILDLSTFGVFRGTVKASDFEPYWGEKKSFFLSEPLRSFDGAEDVAYPLQGYAVRQIRAVAYASTSTEALSLGSSYPIYKLPLPDSMLERELRLDHFTPVPTTDDLIAAPHRYMRTEDKKYVMVSADTSYGTAAAFLNFFNDLNVNIEYKVSTPVIERFTPISLATRAGRNYIDLMTAVTPGTVDFTYT